MSNDALDASRTAGVDVKHPLRMAALDASIGRIARLRGSPREGPEYADSRHSSASPKSA